VLKNLKAVIFDLDDTLYNRNAAQVQIVRAIASRFPDLFQGVKEDRIIKAFLESDRLAVIDFEAGKPTDGMRDVRTRKFLQLLGLKEESSGVITEMYVREYPEINIPIPGAVNAIKNLSKKFSLGLITNGLPDVQYRKVEAIGLKGMFSTVILSEEIGIRKPDPRIFHLAAQALNAQPDECLFVGDSYRNDVAGANASRMRSCWYNPNNVTPDNFDIQADLIISNLEELPRLLNNITD
jgi:putative hydrolase of the HAD superfamily